MQTEAIVRHPYRPPGGFPTGSVIYSDDGSITVASVTTPHSEGRFELRSDEKDSVLHVFVDPFTFRYLEDDPKFEVYQRDAVLEGYGLYIVEQWVVTRREPTYCIATYTGDPHDKVTVNIARIPQNSRLWSPGLRIYFNKLEENHARFKETSVGFIPVTTLSSFPATLNTVPVPDGAIRKHRRLFIINVNLKRMQCTGRTAISLNPPSDAAKSKFLQLFKTSEKIPFEDAVEQIVKMVQTALMMFGEFKEDYIDGVLCDNTERAIQEWWQDFGIPHLKTDVHPRETGFGPVAVASILGLYLGARNRLAAVLGNGSVPKDAFETGQLKHAIRSFQKTIKDRSELRTRRLDPKTMELLHEASKKYVKKQASSNIGPFALGRTIKETVADLSGKPREATIAAVETPDLETFVANINGDWAKFLWYGKNVKSKPEREPHRSRGGRSHRHDDMSTGATTPMYFDSQASSMVQLATFSPSNPANPSLPLHASGSSDPLRRTAIRNMAGRNAEAGLREQEQSHGFRDKIKDAVTSGRRHHRQKQSVYSPRDDGRDSEVGEGSQKRTSLDLDLFRKTSFRKKSSPNSSANKLQEPHDSPRNSQNMIQNSRLAPAGAPKPVSIGKASSAASSREVLVAGTFPPGMERESQEIALGENEKTTSINSTPQDKRPNSLIRAHSFSRLHELSFRRNDDFYPRRLSYSMAEEALSTAPEPLDELIDADQSEPPTGQTSEPPTLYVSPDFDEGVWDPSGAAYREIADIRDWSRKEIKKFKRFEKELTDTNAELKKLEQKFREGLENVKAMVANTIPHDIVPLKEKLEDINGLGQRLTYEIRGLESRVKELADAADGFDAGVARVEEKAVRGGLDVGQTKEPEPEPEDTGITHEESNSELSEQHQGQGWLGWGLGLFKHKQQQQPAVDANAESEPAQNPKTPEEVDEAPQNEVEPQTPQESPTSDVPQQPQEEPKSENQEVSAPAAEDVSEEEDYFGNEEHVRKLQDAVYRDEALQRANRRPQISHHSQTYTNAVSHGNEFGEVRPRARKYETLNRIDTRRGELSRHSSRRDEERRGHYR
ncbi:hypothetical protein BJ508DRAFT_415277 [Ascobolus immersus RN42]|uniref:STB6-like N-terminal domain-containing protein n=1 Tax=Ascobolus immersus RN42 TaxID=1160509 RepID=A0A3N4I3A5_ASCIM|nr:hypothetical protein BJ508DRAFT_415277 [Ascobolus immersus RN42]